MNEFLSKMFSSDFMPHGVCYLWRPEVLWLHATTDSLIALAYFSIPLSIAHFVRKRKDLPFHWIFVMFGIFIFGCGSTHLMEVWTLWNGTYRLAGLVKAVTAAASVATAIALFPLIPKALALPSPDRLREANNRLEAEIAERRRIEEDLHNAQTELEKRVEQRTEDLARANQELQAEIIGRKQLEEQVRQAQKMEALGRMAGGVAHDFNNLLMAISGFNRKVLENVESGTPAMTAAQQVHKAAEQASQLTRQLLAFSRKQVLHPTLIDLNASVSEMSHMMMPGLAQSIELTVDLAPSPAWVRADPTQIHQVILNLSLNARDAMPEGGRLRLGVENLELDAEGAQQRNLSPGTYVALHVSDTGQGMSSEARARIFEPFFTTKPQGAGTGLGLSMVYGVVHQSGGAIQVNSEPGQGTMVSVFLPRAEGALQPNEKPMPPVRRMGGETILLVEDSAMVRELVKNLLIESGYRVLEAGDGNEALSVSDKHTGQIHLLLTDLAMPGMNGQQLAATVSARRPGIKVVFMSAYPPETIGVSGEAAQNFLQKPFYPDDLERMFNRLLGG